MKRFLYLCALCLALSGCSNNSYAVKSDVLTLDTESIAPNTQTIEDILNKNLWSYDKSSLAFGNDLLISASGENFSAICEASDMAGIDTSHLRRGASQTMLATVSLFNPDMSSAGTAYFAFEKRELLCAYYMYNNNFYSLANKLPFEYKTPFAAAENKDKKLVFDRLDEDTDISGIQDIYDGHLVSISGNELVFYDGSDSGLKKTGEVSFGEDMAPADAAIGRSYTCVLVDSCEKAEILSENSYEDPEENEQIVNMKSEKIVFVDNSGEEVLPSLPLDLSIYTSVALDKNRVAAARNNAIDVYEYIDGGWKKQQRLSIHGAAAKLRAEDLDNDGTAEYIVSDGSNISVYKYGPRMQLAWSTKFDLSDISDFYAADLNGDGIKEIYANDTNGFVTRYILGSNGFEVFGGNVTNGERAYFAAGDINGDGTADDLKLTDDGISVGFGKL